MVYGGSHEDFVLREPRAGGGGADADFATGSSPGAAEGAATGTATGAGSSAGDDRRAAALTTRSGRARLPITSARAATPNAIAPTPINPVRHPARGLSWLVVAADQSTWTVGVAPLSAPAAYGACSS